jgi:hypothetical protein
MNAVFDDLETPGSNIFATIAEHKLGQAFL